MPDEQDTKSADAKAQKAKPKRQRAAPAKSRKKKVAAEAPGPGDDAQSPENLTGKSLVVVESPAKARTIGKYLGSGYVVKASIGHIKDLPKSTLGVDIDADFAPQYETIRGKTKVIKEIKDAARYAKAIYLAPDPDREGEAIAWHLADALGSKLAGRIHRITVNEITRQAFAEALANPSRLDRLKYESQQARRILDRIVGYQISPILWDKVRRGLSAGRVQSVAVRLVVEREREITAFVAEEYWTIECLLETTKGQTFAARLYKFDGESPEVGDATKANELALQIRAATCTVACVTKKERKRRPLPPLITSRLQQEASSRFRFTAKRTMAVAQQLYEGVDLGAEGAVALITYMRTDSTRISGQAVAFAREHIRERYGAQYLPDEPIFYRSKKGAQDAHEAIRPTSMAYPPARVAAHLTPDQRKVYQLIWDAFVACQMLPAIYDQTVVDVQAGTALLRATGSYLRFDGFLKIWGVNDEEDSALPEVAAGEVVLCQNVTPEQHFTQPPPRFSEGTLVKELEDKGIGRPSTYATIISTIVSRGYVEKREGRFVPTDLGVLVTDLLTESFPLVLDVGFTARMEQELDDVEDGKVDWIALLKEFYFGGFKDRVEDAKIKMRDVKREEFPTDHVCDKDGGMMMRKWGRNGSFLACKNYPKCRNTRDYKLLPDGTMELVVEETSDVLCPTCGGAMLVKRGRFGKFLACAQYPECKGTRPMSIGVDCPLGCGGYVAQRRSKRGRFFYGCARYPDCKFVSWDRPVAGPCPLCEAPFLVVRVKRGGESSIRCATRGCKFTRDPELDDSDARAAAEGGG